MATREPTHVLESGLSMVTREPTHVLESGLSKRWHVDIRNLRAYTLGLGLGVYGKVCHDSC